MATRIVEGKKPYTGGKAIEITDDKVINLRLREENNLIIYDEGDDEIYVDLQLPDGVRPLDAFPVGVTTGRVLVADDWDITGTIICAKTTSGDNIKLLYGDNGTLWIDNGTGTFKQIYFRADVDLIAQRLQAQIDVLYSLGKFLSLWDCANGEPMSFPLSTPYNYNTGDWYMIGNVSSATPAVNYRPEGSQWNEVASETPENQIVEIGDVYIYDGNVWLLQHNKLPVGSGNVIGPDHATDGDITLFDGITGKIIKDSGKSLNDYQEKLTAGANITIDQNNEISATDTTYTAGTNIQISAQNVISATGGADIEYKTQAEYNALLPGALTDGKHYFIYTSSTPTPTLYTITGSTTVGSFTPGSFSDLQGFFMSPDGLNAYATFWNNSNGRMAQYSLSTPWDISTASQTQYISVTKPNGFCFSNDGTYMFYSTENGNNIVRYTLSTPRDISTASQDAGQSLSVPSNFAINVSLSNDGSYIYFGINDSYTIYEYELTTPFDLTTATNQKTKILTTQSNAVNIRKNGKYLYIACRDSSFGPVRQYELATPYDITSTMTEIGSNSTSYGEGRCLFVSDDCKYWAIGNNSGGITQFEAQPIS